MSVLEEQIQENESKKDTVGRQVRHAAQAALGTRKRLGYFYMTLGLRLGC